MEQWLSIFTWKLGTKELLRVIPSTLDIDLEQVEYDDSGEHESPQLMKHASVFYYETFERVESSKIIINYRYLSNGMMMMMMMMMMHHGLEWVSGYPILGQSYSSMG